MPSEAVKTKTKKFLKLYGNDIAKALSGTPIFLATAVGQKCNESGYGTSPLAVKYNNFGGIRGLPKEAIGKTSNGWAIFKTPQDCFRAYARFITEKPQYAQALKATSPEQQILALVNAGYCKIGWQVVNGKRIYFSDKDYLAICQGAVDISRDLVPGGRVTAQNLTSSLGNIQTHTL
jgi:hypothetical protein